MIKKTFKLSSKSGMNDKPISVIVNAANTFSSEISIQHKDKSMNLKSIMGVMTLAIPNGGEFTISCNGEDEEQALNGLEKTIENEGLLEV